MIFREDFPMFWLGVLGVLALTGACTNNWNKFTAVGSIAALLYMGLYALSYGLP